MKWYKHICTSLSDPDISDGITLFGSDAYIVYFGILELMGREFDEEKPEVCQFSDKFLSKSLQVSFKKITKILEFYQERKRFFFKIMSKNSLTTIEISNSKFTELCDNWTSKKLQSNFVATTKKLSNHKEEEVEEEKEVKDIPPNGGNSQGESKSKKPKDEPYRCNPKCKTGNWHVNYFGDMHLQVTGDKYMFEVQDYAQAKRAHKTYGCKRLKELQDRFWANFRASPEKWSSKRLSFSVFVAAIKDIIADEAQEKMAEESYEGKKPWQA